MKEKKAVIIGSSIAGSALALLLSKHMQVKVFEQKPKNKIHEKVCANVVTSSFIDSAKELELDIKKILKKRFNSAQFHSQNNSVTFPVNDYEIDRKELLEQLVKKACSNGAEFCFEAKFLDLGRVSSGLNVLLEKNKKKIIENADFVIGADGALSNVARKAKLGQKRKFWIALHTKINIGKKLRKIKPGCYEIFFIKKFGYYAYIFPSRKYFVIGVVANPKNARHNLNCFLNFLKIKRYKTDAALIPMPQVVRTGRGNIFLAGDAACQLKFTGGGIVPAIESSLALRDIIVYGNKKRMNSLEKEIGLHQMIAKVLSRLSDSEMDGLFEIAKDSSTRMAAKSRDELRRWVVGFVFKHLSLLRFLPRLF